MQDRSRPSLLCGARAASGAASRRGQDAKTKTDPLFWAAVEASLNAIVMVDEAGRIALANPAAEDLTGYHREELLGQAIEILVPERFRDRHVKLREGFSAQRRTRRMFATPGIYLRRKDGSEVAVEIGLNPIETPKGRFIVSCIVDADELRRMRSLIATANHLASVDRLAAGVAHGINNPLAYVMSNVSFALQELEELRPPAAESGVRDEQSSQTDPLLRAVPEIREALAHASEGSARIRDLVADLLALTSKREEKIAVFDLHSVLASVLNLSESEIRHRARLTTQYDVVPRIRGDASALAHVLFNLLVNAVECIPEGNPAQNEIRVSTRTDVAGAAVIEIRDSGSGIPPEIIDRIFEPFYTTKTEGSSAGLGLSVAQGIVKAMGGEITVESAIGKGSLFRVTLPSSSALGSAATPSLEHGAKTPSTSRTP